MFFISLNKFYSSRWKDVWIWFICVFSRLVSILLHFAKDVGHRIFPNKLLYSFLTYFPMYVFYKNTLMIYTAEHFKWNKNVFIISYYFMIWSRKGMIINLQRLNIIWIMTTLWTILVIFLIVKNRLYIDGLSSIKRKKI